jgi:hypothetical protein
VNVTTKARKKCSKPLPAILGFVYGAILAFFAIAWGVDGPTLTLPLATSPLPVPVAILDNMTSPNIDLLEALMLTCIASAPFGWMILAHKASRAKNSRTRIILVTVLTAHYAGIALSFAVWGDYLLRPFRVLTMLGGLLIAFYAAGQGVLWWVLMAHRKSENEVWMRP